MNIIEPVLSFFFILMSFIYLSWIFSLVALPHLKKKKVYYYDGDNYSPKITVLIPAHNEEESIERTVRSVLSADYDNKIEVIVVNDGSNDRTGEIVKEISKKENNVNLLNTVEHGGKANAINEGVKTAKNEIIVVLDADSLVEKNALKEIVSPFSDELIGATSGIIRAIDNNNFLVWFQDFEYVLTSAWRRVSNNLNATYILPGFAAFRRSALKDVGGFSRDVFSEDFEVGLKLKKKGYKLEMTKGTIYTWVPQTIRGLIKQRIRWGRGTIQVVRKHSDIPFNKDYGAVGLYGIPTQLYWFVHGFVVLPITFYQIFGGYYEYFAAFNNFFSFDVFRYFFGWFSIYGIIDYSYNTILGNYQLTFLFYLVLINFILNLMYNAIAVIKVGKPKLKFLFSIFFFFPYSVLVLTCYIFPFFYNLKKRSIINKWEKAK